MSIHQNKIYNIKHFYYNLYLLFTFCFKNNLFFMFNTISTYSIRSDIKSIQYCFCSSLESIQIKYSEQYKDHDSV
jgi:heme/copper-type cytochrome/quinol oxidase subunit 1